MSRRKRILLIVGGSIAGLLLLLVVAAVITVQTDWFRNYVREKIVAVTQDSTGGRVELGSFDFEWTKMRATMRNFVIHGTEPANVPPLFSADLVQVDLKLLSGFKKMVDLQSLIVDRPVVNLIVNADGTTNIPEPKIKKQPSDKSGLETVVDLAIGKFELRNGLMMFAEQKTPISARGENVTAQLFYNLVKVPHYEGRVSINPLRMTYANNQPLDLSVTIPVTLEQDAVRFADAKIGTAESQLVLSGAVENMKNPRITARVNGNLSLLEARRFADLPISEQAGKTLPGSVDVEAALTMDDKRIDVQSARLRLGQSTLEASGTLKDESGAGGLQFKSTLALGEAGRLFKVEAQPQGTVQAEGTAKMRGSEYTIDGNMNGRGVSFRQGDRRIENVNLASSFHVDPKRIELNDANLSAFGGQFTGDVAIENMRQFSLDGRLANLDIQSAASAFGQKLPYDGRVSGPVKASGDLKAPGTSGINATVNLAIAPGKRGIPVSGRLNAVYSGSTDSLQVSNSRISLPNTTLDINGALGRQLNFKLTSRNLEDLVPPTASGARAQVKKFPVVLQAPATFTGAVSGSLSNPRITGHLEMARFLVEGRQFDRLSADVEASKSRAALQNALLTRGPMQTRAEATVGLVNWKPLPRSPLTATASIRNGDLADIMVLAGKPGTGTTGALSADLNVSGTYGNPTGGATLAVAKGTIYNEPFDRIDGRVNLSDQLVTIPGVVLTAGPSRVELSGRFEHPPDSFTTGRVQMQVRSNEVQLARLQAIVKQRPGLAGVMQLNGNIAGTLAEKAGQTEFLLSNVNADFAIRNLQAEGKDYGNLTGTARTSGNTVSYKVDSNFAQADIRVNGQTRLEPQYPTTASATVGNLPIEQVLALAGKGDVPARGLLSGSASFSGTMDKATANADLTLAKAVLYQEPVDRIALRANYTPERIDVPSLDIAAGPSRLALTASYAHAPGDMQNGQLEFRVNPSSINLAQLRNVQRMRPGLAGVVRLVADGAAAVKQSQVLLSRLNADVGANDLSVNKADIGDLKLTAQTRGDTLDFNLTSDIANAVIRGSGRAQLRGDYPLTANLELKNVTYAGLRPLLGSSGPAPNWNAFLDGRMQVSGPAMRPADMKGSMELSRVAATVTPSGTNTKPITIQNQGPVVVALDRSTLRIQSAHLVGPQTDIKLAGSAPIDGSGPMNVTVAANANLGVIQDVSKTVYASGAIVLNAAVRGTISDPLVNGALELKNASLNHIEFPNGISNANGVIRFNGRNASIQNLTAESGGGKISVTGAAGLRAGVLNYNIRANANDVRLRYPEGVTIVASTNLNLTGSTERSLLAGTVTLESFTFSPRQDFGSMLARTSQPVEVPEAPTGPLAGMRLDIRVRTAATATFETSLAQNIQADASLRVRGTAASPGVIGRINITQGEIVFFGTKYTVSQGTVAFYNPVRIQPVLNIDLQTLAKGVNVTLNVSGAMDNMKLTYTSDPPLQFTEVVALLAAGRTPTSDPNLVAREPAMPPQSLQQMGQSAILSRAVANPVANRLERVFGISNLKIDPSFTTGSQLPQARLTMQQQITSKITFTYITNLAQTNSQIVRVEWAMNENWSATATREENGRFGVDFFYKRRIR